MDYLAKQTLGKKDENVKKESHFFKTTTRVKHNAVFKQETCAAHIATGQYHPDEWQLKPGQLWIDTMTRKRILGFKTSKTGRDKYPTAYVSKNSVTSLYTGHKVC